MRLVKAYLTNCAVALDVGCRVRGERVLSAHVRPCLLLGSEGGLAVGAPEQSLLLLSVARWLGQRLSASPTSEFLLPSRTVCRVPLALW